MPILCGANDLSYGYLAKAIDELLVFQVFAICSDQPSDPLNTIDSIGYRYRGYRFEEKNTIMLG